MAASSGLILCVVVEQLRQRHACVVTRDEWRTDLRPHRPMGEAVSLLEQRQTFQKPLAAFQTMIHAASEIHGWEVNVPCIQKALLWSQF